ncbi:Ca2+-binding protein, EF-hand superfamily [Sphingopyxis sp. YR583]|uniref:EF-hand domain-containing protein n=1 Tax=Sphingopyxis sp. YR583 TaxID=1881047 RepID=UPI0008A80026|nr:hypothetical protein [Sphingopyxis sp. YR583]SEH11489.1 Ca2+-binding protein, EF-hand superfamily [Sphingopyxis sp. YR583]
MRLTIVPVMTGVAILMASNAMNPVQAQPVEIDGLPAVLLDRLGSGRTYEQYVSELVNRVRQSDRNGDGLDADDVAFVAAERTARDRAGAISEVLRKDYDGDQRVTLAELNRGIRNRNPNGRDEAAELLRRFDSDHDDAITIAEVVATTWDRGDGERLAALVALDPNRDGKLAPIEMRLLAQAAFERIDSDGDGEISKAEFTVIAAQHKKANFELNAVACPLPPVPAKAQLIVYGGRAQALSSVAIGDRDTVTGLINVEIEPGSTPLYLVLTSHDSTLWRFSGATDRVVHAVLSSVTASAGAISASGALGLPASKLTISRAGCPEPLRTMEEYQAGKTRAAVKASLGRTPDLMLAHPQVQQLSLPSGQVVVADERQAKVPLGFDSERWILAARDWEAGVAFVNPRQVVAKAPVEKYLVYPDEVGLSQLIGEGALIKVGLDRYRIVRPIPHLPSYMSGGQSVTLIVAQGVPVPAGDPGYSCIMSEETGKPLSRNCRSN